jgi:hypothetical protein
MALKLQDEEANVMSDIDVQKKSTGAVHDWLITVAIVFISLFGVILALITIFSLPDQSVRPSTGAVFYLCSAVLISLFLFFRWKKEKALEEHALLNRTEGLERIFVKETISDKIIKWLVTIYSVFFIFAGISISLIIIYALPDKTTQPKVALFFYLGGSIVLASFIIVVWKNWTSKMP